MSRFFLYIVCMIGSLCSAAWAECVVVSQAEKAESVSFNDISKFVELDMCELVVQPDGVCELVATFKNKSDEPVQLDTYSHSGVEQVALPYVAVIDEEDEDEEDEDEEDEGEEDEGEEDEGEYCGDACMMLTRLPERIEVPANGTTSVSQPLPVHVVEWLKTGKYCEFGYPVQFWKKGDVAVDGDGDFYTFSTRSYSLRFLGQPYPKYKYTIDELPKKIELPTLAGRVEVCLELEKTQKDNEYILILSKSAPDVELRYYATEDGWCFSQSNGGDFPSFWCSFYSPADILRGRSKKTVQVLRPPAAEVDEFESGIQISFYEAHLCGPLGTVEIIVYSKYMEK